LEFGAFVNDAGRYKYRWATAFTHNQKLLEGTLPLSDADIIPILNCSRKKNYKMLRVFYHKQKYSLNQKKTSLNFLAAAEDPLNKAEKLNA
jgi:hypothetical protein